MANITQKRKYTSRSDPQFSLWFWCIAIQCFVTLPCIYGKCLDMENLSLTVYPEGMLNMRYGQPLEVYCTDDSAQNLEFKINGKSVPTMQVNETTRRLYIEHPARGTYTYYCMNNATRKFCPVRILVDSTPADVSDFACISNNLDALNCSWSTPTGQSLSNHTITFNFDGNSVNACQASYQSGKTYCFWNTSTIPRYRQMEKQYNMTLQICNGYGCNEQNFTIDHFSVVKPKPPNNLRIVAHDAHSVLLQWSIPYNMVNFLPNGIDHKIEYQIAKIDNTSYFRKVDTSGLPAKNRTYKFLLSDLPYAHMAYEVRIYIRPKEAVKDEFWSDFTYIVFNTANERPNRPPETVVGAFDQASYESKRVLYIYWKQLEEYEEAGANFTYKIVAHQKMRNPITLLADSKKSLSYVILNEASLGPINIDIWSTNDKGSSLASSHLYIPPSSDTEALRVPSFTKLAYENGTYKISWVGVDNIDNYTVFWCQHNATQICAGRMNFTILEPNKTNHVIDLPRESRFQFAISGNSGMRTSGMVWATCDISKDAIQMYGFPVKVNHGPAGKSSVEITWTMFCTLQENVITGYLLTYCPVINVTTVCDASVGNKSSVYISDPKQNNIFITDLKPYKTYTFNLSLNTTFGLKTLENASTGVTTTEDTPTSPRNVSVTEVESDSLVISWDPPLHENGVIGYVIYNYGVKYCEVKSPEKNKRDKNEHRISFKIERLEGFSNYTWSVMACNIGIGSCSESSPKNGIFVRTRIGHPGKLKSPTILNNPDKIQWVKPEKPRGGLDSYQILRVKDDQHKEILNTTDLSFELVHCDGGVRVVKYQVRAINCDEDPYHGVLADRAEVQLPEKEHARLEYLGEWSDPSTVACRAGDGFTTAFILMAVFALVAIMYGSLKLTKKIRKMKDIEPVLPIGLGIPEKDISIYAFGWNQSSKEEKPPSDEMLLLPDTKATVSTDTKQKDENNCGASDHTDSTVLSEGSRDAVDRQVSTSDDGSDSSMHLEVEAVRADTAPHGEEDCSSSDCEMPHDTTYFNNELFKKNPTSGYVQQPVVNPATGYVSSPPAATPASMMSPPASLLQQPASSSYVMAALPPPVFTTDPPLSSGYVRPEHAQTRSMLNFPSHKSSPTTMFGPESLPIMPIMPTLPPATKHVADSSYIPLQSLPSHKPVESSVGIGTSVEGRTLKPAAAVPAASSGYVSPEDAVMNKHLGHLRGARHEPPAAILDPAMSPAAYCRFSWSADPANDNLHTLFANSPAIDNN